MRFASSAVVLGFLAIALPASSAPRPAREFGFEISSNKPWVRVRVDGSEPQNFILDAGSRGSSYVGRECADRLHLKLGPERMLRIGAGQGVEVPFTFSLDVTLDVAGDTCEVPGVGVFPLEHVSVYEGRRLDGMLGEDFFRRHVVTIDYAKATMRIEDPDTYRHRGPGTPIPITFDGGLAVADAVLTPVGRAPIPCRVVIDTGVRSTVVWYHPFVVAHDLVATQPHALAATVGGGVGGESTGDVGRIADLTIGDLHVVRPTAVFSRDTTGVFAGTEEAGLVGGEILRRCRVTFDYAHARLWLEPDALPVGGFDADMSGLFLVGTGEDFHRVTVQSVAAGTPAADAGLAKGDEIVTVDGRDAARLTLDDVRDRLKHEGATCRLRVRRGADERDVTLKLRRLV